MKIALDVSSIKFKFVGIGRYMHMLLQHYLQLFPEHEYLMYRVVGFRNFFPDPRLLSFEKKKCRIRTVGLIGRYANVIRKWVPLDEFFLPDIDVFHGNSPYFPSFRKKNKKIILTVHDLIPLVHPEWSTSTLVNLWVDFAKRFPLLEFDKLSANSEFTKRDFVNFLKVPPEKIKVIHLAVDSQFSQPIPKEKVASIIKQFELETGYILAVGTLEPRKNIHRVIEAYSILKEERKIREKLVITGWKDRTSKPILEAYEHSKFQEDIRFTGYIPDSALMALYQGARVLVYPSLYEGFGLPILEGFASGVPVVASNSSSLPEVGGDAVVYVDPYDVHSIAEGIAKVLEDDVLRESLIQKGKHRLKLFSWEKTARETFALYTMP
jgi:glycosyltransferase involved in cell wall biosynthesis